jgi:hypothetical protein
VNISRSNGVRYFPAVSAPRQPKTLRRSRPQAETLEVSRLTVPVSTHHHIRGLEEAPVTLPGVVQGELCDLVNLIASLEDAISRLVPQIVESEVLDSEELARARERGSDASRVVREDVLMRAIAVALLPKPQVCI